MRLEVGDAFAVLGGEAGLLRGVKDRAEAADLFARDAEALVDDDAGDRCRPPFRWSLPFFGLSAKPSSPTT